MHPLKPITHTTQHRQQPHTTTHHTHREMSLRAGRANYPGDTACCILFEANTTAKSTFGNHQDGLAAVDTALELFHVLEDDCGLIKVVRVINFCQGVGMNYIGCGWQNRWGIAVVRFTFRGLDGEGTLWLHELGHNIGLTHARKQKRVMHASVSRESSGLTKSECSAFLKADYSSIQENDEESSGEDGEESGFLEEDKDFAWMVRK
eukprot:m.143176 g.143176  ORF g.143176 m.143176 type:complete len:206 (+) comp24208_c0_seq1:110-727(+)